MTQTQWTKLPHTIVYDVNRKDGSLTLAGADMDERHPGNPQWSVNIDYLYTNGHYTWSSGTAVSPEGITLRGIFGKAKFTQAEAVEYFMAFDEGVSS
jgi:hypothetical protein